MKNPNKEGGHSLIGFIAFCQSRSSLVLQTKRGILRRPASVLAPGSALGSLPSVALSSAQAVPIIVQQERAYAGKSPMPSVRRTPDRGPINRSWRDFFSIDRRIAKLHNLKTHLPHPQAKE